MLQFGTRWERHWRDDDFLANEIGRGEIVYGVSDRFAYFFPLRFGWAVLEQQPLDGRVPNKLSLRVDGGVEGIGFGGWAGFMVVPGVGVRVKHRLSSRTWVEADARALALVRPEVAPVMGLTVGTVSGAVGWQIFNRVALTLRPFVTRERSHSNSARTLGGTRPTTDEWRTWTWLGATLGIEVRPWSFLSLVAGTSLSHVRFARDDQAPPNPDAALVAPTHTYGELAVNVGVVARW